MLATIMSSGLQLVRMLHSVGMVDAACGASDAPFAATGLEGLNEPRNVTLSCFPTIPSLL